MPTSMRQLLIPLLLWAAALLSACDTERAARLEEGVSTEADVRAQFGEPVQITERADGHDRPETEVEG